MAAVLLSDFGLDPYPSGKCRACEQPMSALLGKTVEMVCVNPTCPQVGKVTENYEKEVRHV